MEKGLAAVKVVLVAAGALLMSCDQTGSDNLCLPDAQNLIQDADFALEAADSSSAFWGQSQHAGEVSFETSVTDGALTINKIGTQPWFAYRQILQSAEFSGRELVFSADLKLDMREPKKAHGLGYGGWLRVVARSAGGGILARSKLEQEPHIGTTDWRHVSVVMALPNGTRRVDLTILHQADGMMSVRNPYFGPELKCGEL